MTYHKIFPVSQQYLSTIIPETFETDIYSDSSLKCAIIELGICKANMYLKSPNSKQFWIGTTIKDQIEVYIVGWTDNSWIIKYKDTVYYLPFHHFIELRNIKAGPLN